jgi:hypothetical protein
MVPNYLVKKEPAPFQMPVLYTITLAKLPPIPCGKVVIRPTRLPPMRNPHRSRMWRTIPMTSDPHPASVLHHPVAAQPDVIPARRVRTNFHNHRGRRRPDEHHLLRRRRGRFHNDRGRRRRWRRENNRWLRRRRLYHIRGWRRRRRRSGLHNHHIMVMPLAVVVVFVDFTTRAGDNHCQQRTDAQQLVFHEKPVPRKNALLRRPNRRPWLDRPTRDGKVTTHP